MLTSIVYIQFYLIHINTDGLNYQCVFYYFNISFPKYILNIYLFLFSPTPPSKSKPSLSFTLPFIFIFLKFIYLFLAVLGLRFCARAFSSCGERGPLFIAVLGPLTIVASLVAEHRLQTRRLSSCSSRA